MVPSVHRAWRALKKFVAALLSPPACAYCNRALSERRVFCDSCKKQLQPVVSQELAITATKTVKVYAVAAYKDPIKQLVLAKLWSDVIATKHLADLMWESTPIAALDFDCIVSIPLHWTRRIKRGYNQAEEIARELAKISGKPWVNALKRTRMTAYQAELAADAREHNVAGAFVLNERYKNKLCGKRILLVDDLYTTGSTVKAAAKILYQSKPSAIYVVVACRVI